MSVSLAILIDERDNRIGKLMVGSACLIIKYKDAFFVRTGKAVKIHHSHRALAVVFEQTEPFVRNKLEPV